jgi:very-short-patch-repair endonuclease
MSREQYTTRYLNQLPRVLTSQSISKNRLHAGAASGAFVKLLPGCYVEDTQLPSTHLPTYMQVNERAKLQLAAGIIGLREDEALSHWSAGIAWDLPWYGTDTRVHILRTGCRGLPRTGTAIHASINKPYLVTTPDGITLTNLEQTVVHLAAASHPSVGLAYLDHAQRIGASAMGLRTVCDETLVRGRAKVQRLIGLSVNNSDSAKESECRYWLYKAGVENVETQYRVDTELGTFYADMWVKDTPLLFEYDGESKYSDDPRALFKEKQREDALRAAGFVVVRVTSRHLNNPERFMIEVRHRLTSHNYSVPAKGGQQVP